MGAADANQGGGPGGEAFGANWLAANVAYFVRAGIEFPQGCVNRRKMCACLIDERRNVLPFERDRGSLGVVLVVAPGRTLVRAGHNRREIPPKLGDLVKCLVTDGVQPGPGELGITHLHRL